MLLLYHTRFQYASVRVLHMSPFFLAVDIQRSQCPYRFLNTREMRTSSIVTQTTPQEILLFIVMPPAVETMQCDVIVLDTTVTTNTLYERENTVLQDSGALFVYVP